MEFARAWQEEAGASLVDPDIVDALRDCEVEGDEARLLLYAEELLESRVEAGEGRGALAQLRVALDAVHVLAPILGIFVGAALLTATLPSPELRPVNVFVFVGEGILLPALFGAATVGLSLGAGRALTRTHWLAWVVGLLSRRALSTRLGALTGRVLRGSGVAGPLLGSLSHLFWLGALSAFGGLAAWRFLFTDYLFAWSSTMPLTGQGVQDVFSFLAAPVAWLPGVGLPTAEQVTVSEWASLAEGYARGTGDPGRDEFLRKGWFSLLLASLAFWGLLPRVAAWAGSRWLLRRRVLRGLRSPGSQAVLDALDAPRLTTLAAGDGAGPARSLLPVEARPSPALRRTGLDVVAFATERPGPRTLEHLRLDRLGLSGAVHLVPEDDDDDAMGAALDALGAGAEGAGGAVVAFAVVDSPGRLREAFLRDVVAAVAGGSVHVLLTGLEAYRQSPRGRSLAERLRAWHELAERVGVPAERVHLDEESP